MWSLLIPILAQLPGLLGNFFKQKNEILVAQNAAQLQIELAKQNLAAEIAKGQLDLNKTIVNSTGSYFKYFTFFMWFGPFMVGTLFPHISKEIFINWGSMPEWYITSCITIMFTVWGISISANAISGIFSGVSEFFLKRQQIAIPRKLFYDTLRSVKGNITQHEVDLYNKALDKLDKDNAKDGN